MKRKVQRSGRYFAVTRAAAIEALETRRLLASIVVNSDLDSATPGDGLTTLREAITQANADAASDSITFNLGGGGHTINLASALPDLSTDVNINGPGASLLTVRGDIALAGIFNVAPNAVVGLSGMTVTNAVGTGITNGGTLTVENCTITGNTAGGISNGGVLTLKNCTISHNSILGFGGGIANSVGGVLTIIGSTIRDNTASLGSGGIFNAEPGTVTIIDSTLSGNTTPGFRGGAIGNSGGTVTIDRSTLINNNGGGIGGAIYNERGNPDTGIVIITNSTLSDNTADNGGGIYNFGTLALSNSTISGNAATNAGGGIFNEGTLNIHTSTISANTVGDGILNGSDHDEIGGGICNTTGTVTIEGSIVSGNIAAAGAGIFTSPLNVFQSPQMTILASTISDNHADSFEGGGIVNGGELTIESCTISNNTAIEAGGIWNASGQTLTIRDCTLSGNTAVAEGGAIVDFGTGITIVNSTLTGNHAILGEGGGIFTGGNGPMLIQGSTISGNSAGDGGGIRNNSGQDIVVNNSIVAGNTAAAEFTDISGPVTGSYDFIGDGTGMVGLIEGVRGNHVGTAAHPIDPKLGPLADNGGPTMTMALLPGSPCINAGQISLAGLPDFDQRGNPFKRVIGGRVDIGAFEFATPAQMAEELLELIGGLPLDAGNRNGLSAKLNLKGNSGDAGKVGAFINRLDAFINAGKLTAAQADPLLELAGFLLDVLS